MIYKNVAPLPLYDYLYQCIRQDIIDGKLTSGEKLPSKRSLAQHLNVGLITVANAYAQLAVEGYITSIEKKAILSRISATIAVKKRFHVPSARTAGTRICFADFKANRISLKNFPLATWNKLMRETLSLHNENLLKTVPYNGLYELRKAIADYLLNNRAMEVNPAQIIIGAGTEYLYSRLMRFSAEPAPLPLKIQATKNLPPFPPASVILGNIFLLMKATFLSVS